MSIESLRAEIEYVLEDGFDMPVAYAAINDFLRSQHEVFIKSGRDQVDLLLQVQTTLGSTPAHHLGRVISIENQNFKSYPASKNCPLFNAVIKLCSERGLALDYGRALFSHFLKALDEERFDEKGNYESSRVITYFAVGPEAAYHLGGLFVGDDAELVSTEMEYLDYRLKRFRTIIERWEMELAWDKEDNE